MNDETIKEIVAELARSLKGCAFGKVFQLSRASLAIDFRTGGGTYLFIAAEPGSPRLYLISRTVRELEKSSLPPSQFPLSLRRALSGAILKSVTKDEHDRVVRFDFSVRDAVGDEHTPALVAQLTGRTSNIFLLDEAGRVVDSLRPAHGEGQGIADLYQPPTPPQQNAPAPKESLLARGEFASLSAAADNHYRGLELARTFDARASAAMTRLRQEISKRLKLRDNLERDLARHGDAATHKRTGDLLLANIANAERIGDIVRVRDYYAEDAPLVELKVDENKSLQEEAAAAFARYGKSKRAAQEIAQRLENVRLELIDYDDRLEVLQSIIEERDEAALESFVESAKKGQQSRQQRQGGAKKSKQVAESIPGVRRYLSSDGYEILVGRGAKDNEQLTFRIARSYDTWLHAADYPGSHVVVRNPRRGEDIPHRTLVEAAQLAAHFSQARDESKAAVNHTPRKFVSKIKGAAPGLVRLASFRTILVEPRESLERV